MVVFLGLDAKKLRSMGWSKSGVSYSRSGPYVPYRKDKKGASPTREETALRAIGPPQPTSARDRPERNFVPAVARRYGATGPAPGRLTPDTPLGRIPLAAAVGFNARALGEPGDDALALYVKSDAMCGWGRRARARATWWRRKAM